MQPAATYPSPEWSRRLTPNDFSHRANQIRQLKTGPNPKGDDTMSVTGPDENELGDVLAELERRRHAERVQMALRDWPPKGDFTFSPERHTAAEKSPSVT